MTVPLGMMVPLSGWVGCRNGTCETPQIRGSSFLTVSHPALQLTAKQEKFSYVGEQMMVP